MRNWAIYVTLIGLSANAQAVSPQSDLLLRSQPIYLQQQSMFSNPGIKGYQDTLSISKAIIEKKSLDTDETGMPQNGTGEDYILIGAESYLHLDEAQTVWGNAAYTTGKILKIKWSNCIDYNLIGPYVLGDEVGGDMSFRRYTFAGGYSYQLSERWSIGAAIDYRAELAWRDVDPRIKTIVSDLNAHIGTSYRYCPNRFVGLSASLKSYTQNCELEFYNPTNDINTLPLTGLGSFNKRFAGNTNQDSGHSGLGGEVALQMMSVDGTGLQVSLTLSDIVMHQMLHNFNNLTLASTNTSKAELALAYGFRINDRILCHPVLEGAYQHRLGTENLFGTAQGASYNKIGSRRPYLLKRAYGSINIPVEIGLPNGFLTVSPSVQYGMYDEALTSLNRKMKSSAIISGVKLHYSHLVGKWLVNIGGDYYYQSTFNNNCLIPGYNPESSLQKSVVTSYDVMSASTNTYGGDIAIWRNIAGLMYGLTVKYDYVTYSGHVHDELIYATLRINF